jgi:luciferase family oxidoreductase group 1
VLASSGATAAMAGSMGLGYGFAKHFSPAPPGPAIRAYRASFTPSPQFPRAHVILGVAVVCAPTDNEAEYLASSTDLAWVRRHHGVFAPLPSPEEAARHLYTPEDRAVLESNRQRQIVGGPATVAGALEQLVEDTSADELMITTMIYGAEERRRSYELVAGAWGI